MTRMKSVPLLCTLFGLPGLALAAPPTLNSGDTAWMIVATALVLLMTIPGLALFYAGMVRAKNVLSVLMQCFAITGLISVLWVVYGYSLVFDTTGMEKGVVNLASGWADGVLHHEFGAHSVAPFEVLRLRLRQQQGGGQTEHDQALHCATPCVSSPCWLISP